MDRGTFESNWPKLEPQLRSALARRRIPVDAREDILQETALRLIRSWDHIRPESLWAFALTVSLNIVRDEARKKERRDRSGYECPVTERDPEHEALVRIELDRVRVAFDGLNERQRTILLGEIGEAAVSASTPAQKMARMRARRRLRALMEDASSVVALSYLKLRRLVGDADAVVAGTAARFGMRVAALTTATAIAVPVAIGSSAAAPIRPPKGYTEQEAGRSGFSLSIASMGHDVRPGRRTDAERTSGALMGRRDIDGHLNRHFGVVHRDGDSIVVGGEDRIGPYGAEQSVVHEIAGSTVGAGVTARVDRTRCLTKRIHKPHMRCRRNGRLRARVRAVVDETAHEVDVDTLVGSD